MDGQSSDASEDKVVVHNNCNCVIENLLERKFASLPDNEKEIIIKSPKPTPMMNITIKTKTKQRYFHKEIYDKVSWICGCAYLLKLFCWPCILFSREHTVWDQCGFSAMHSLSKLIKEHECTQSHLLSLIRFKKFTRKIRTDLHTALIEENEIYNKEVAANRYILSKFISCICFLTKGNQNYIELLHLFSESDTQLKIHLNNSTELSGLINKIQNDMISAISKVLLDKIKSEIRASKFVSIIIEECKDKFQKSQLFTVLRYLDENNEIQERFIGFSDVSSDRTADTRFHYIRKTLEEFGCSDKLIVQTYDGEVVTPVEHKKLQEKIRDTYHNSFFIHCYSHSLHMVLSQSICHIVECRRFFDYALSYASFFWGSSRILSLLNPELTKQLLIVTFTQQFSDDKLLNMLNECKEEIMVIFNKILDNEDEWDTDSVMNAKILHHRLKDFDFNFYLYLFLSIFNSINDLSNLLQKKIFDISYCLEGIKNFLKSLDDKKGDFDQLWDKLNNDKFNGKINVVECSDNMKLKYSLQYFKVIELLSNITTDRFRDLKRLKFIELFNINNFKKYNVNFPDYLLESLRLSYGKYFDFMKLRSELSYIYSIPNLYFKSLNSLKQSIMRDELQDVVAEVFNLIRLICTMPYACESDEQSTTLKRIRSHIKYNKIGQIQSALTLISLEKKILMHLKNTENFNDIVIDEFCKKETKIKLIFKK